MEKCAFGFVELEYLGHDVSNYGLKATPVKCKEICEWLQSIKLEELWSFLRIANSFRFVPSFDKVAAPLYKLLCKYIKVDLEL